MEAAANGGQGVDWPKLWDRDGSLRPPGLAIWNGHVVGPGDEYGGFLSEPNRIEDSLDVIAALCRDAAVRWLITSTSERRQSFLAIAAWNEESDGKRVGGYRPMVRMSWHASGGQEREATFQIDDLDYNLFCACSAILDARDRAKV